MGRTTAGAAIAAPVRHIASARLRAALGVFVALLLLGIMASSALATTGHIYAGQFGGPGGGAGQFGGGPSGLVVRQSTGDVFVADSGVSRIERFDASGAYQSAINLDPNVYIVPGSLGIDPAGAASLYIGAFDNVAQAPTVLKYTAAGVFVQTLTAGAGTTFTYPVTLAVDQANGSVYVNAADTTTGLPVIDKFSNTGAFVSSFDGSAGAAPDGAFNSIGGIAVDAASRVYVLDNARGKVYRYSAAGAYQTTVDDGTRSTPTAVTADPTSSEVYVVENGPGDPPNQRVAHYSAGGATLVNLFGRGRINGASAIGVKSSGAVYTADAATNFVERFTTFTGPTVTTTAAASVDPFTETLNGTINPNGIASSFHFEYGPDQSYGTSTAEVSVGTTSGPVTIDTDPASPLTPNTTYHVRIVGSNSTGSITGNDTTFTTAAATPLVDDAPANANPIGSASATLNATINPRGSSTTTHFEYGTTTAYGNVTPDDAAAAGAGQGDTAISADIPSGLLPGTTYHFRVVADNGTGGPQAGADQTFTTAPAADGGATSVTAVSATLTGVVNPQSTAASYHFEYGTSGPPYASSTPPATTANTGSDTPVSAPVTGLQPGTTYHVRVVATVNGATVNGDDGTFTTDPAPAATTGEVTGRTTDHAAFSGTADTHGLAGTYQFLVASSTSAYSARTTPVAIAAGGGPVGASGSLGDLLPGGTYTVRLAVTSSGATTFGDEVTFTTAPLPPVQPPPPATTVTNPYGCTAPVLKAYDLHPKPGDTIAIAGTDLGVGGSVALGTEAPVATDWTATGFSLVIPDDATGTLPLTVNCGTVSNTIAITMYKAPSNSYTATGKVKGSTATLSLKVPGPGSITVTGGSVKKATAHAGKAGTTSVKVSLSSAGKKSVKRHKKLTVSLTVRFTPTGGSTAIKTVKVTFKA